MHRAASGDRARAIPLLDEAGATALTMGAPSEAAALWRTAAGLAEDPLVAAAYRSRAEAALGEADAAAGAADERNDIEPPPPERSAAVG